MIQPIVSHIKEICKEIDPESEFNCKTYLFDLVTDPTVPIVQFILIHVKQFIYHNRCKKTKPILQVWQKEISDLHNIELFTAKRNNTVNKMQKRWSPMEIKLSEYRAT